MKDIEVFIDSVSEKFGYSEILKNDLKRIIPKMLAGKDEKKRQMLFDTLSKVKIFVLPEGASLEDLEKCKSEVFGKDNVGITFEETDMGEYSKHELPAGAYVSEPVFDDEMNIIGRNRMLYVQELSRYSGLNQVYGSNINLSHLIHELGHAWAAETDEYIQNPDGSFVQNVGTCAITSRVDKGTQKVISESVDGLFVEETLNTIQEEKVLLELTGAQSISELAEKGYVRSAYQGMQTDIMKSYVEEFGEDVFEEYRYSKDASALADVEQALKDTEAWQILGTQEYLDKKRAKLAEVENLQTSYGERALSSITKIIGLFDKYDDVYFSSNSKFTPIQKLNNVLEQLYDFNSVRYNFNIMDNNNNLEIYKGVVSAIVSEANALRIQAKDVIVRDSNNFMARLKSEVQPPDSQDSYYSTVSKNEAKKEANKEIFTAKE